MRLLTGGERDGVFYGRPAWRSQVAASAAWSLAWRLARWQLGLGVATGLMLTPAGGLPWLAAAALGGAVQALFSLYVAARAFAVPPQHAVASLGAFYRAQLGKWLLAVLIFGLAARFRAEYFLPLLAGYGAGFIGNWLALLWSPYGAARRKRNHSGRG